MRTLLSAAVLTLCAGVLNATTINVPADQPTIQAGINAAQDYDTVLVAPGTYTENVVFPGDDVLVVSSHGPPVTFLEPATTSTHVVRIIGGEGMGAGISGFTIQNSGDAAAVYIDGSSPTIHHNVFRLNMDGYIGNQAPLRVRNNSSPSIHHNLFDENGGVANVFIQSPALFYNNTIVNSQRAGIIAYHDNALILNNIVVGCPLYGLNASGYTPTVDYNNIYMNSPDYSAATPGAHDISLDPLFVDTAQGDYGLSESSPCVDAGHPDPQYNDPDGTRNDMGAIPFDASTAPEVNMLLIEGSDSAFNVVDHTPLIEWSYTDPLERRAQTQVEVAVGTDNDWDFAEMWNPVPFQTPDTFVTYAGAVLMDGETYYLRLRVHNGVAWSNWYETGFRMNSVPSVPVPLHPIDDEQTDNQPTLWVQNSTDAEGDALTYDFFCCVDTTYGEPDPIYEYDIAEGTDSTGWQVTEPLDENKRYGWIVRAYDGYEYSDWTASYEYMFFVNGTPEPPAAPQAQYPPDTSGLPVFDMLTYFYWSPSNDPDPLDTIRYKLEVSMDPGFTFVNTIDSLMSTPYTLTDSLAFSTHYWWRVTAFDNTGLSTMSPNTPDFWTWTLGDLDHSHAVDISDLVMLVDYMFNSGPPPYRLFLADIDGSCSVDISDLVYLVDYMFLGGPAPLVGCEPE